MTFCPRHNPTVLVQLLDHQPVAADVAPFERQDLLRRPQAGVGDHRHERRPRLPYRQKLAPDRLHLGGGEADHGAWRLVEGFSALLTGLRLTPHSSELRVSEHRLQDDERLADRVAPDA